MINKDASTEQQLLVRTLAQQVADKLAEQSAEGLLMPGTRLIETKLSEQFQVSRGTIREAIRILESMGLAEIRPQRGSYISSLSGEEVLRLFPVRAALLSEASRLASERGRELKQNSLNAQLNQLKQNIQREHDYVKSSKSMVNLIIKIADNPMLVKYASDLDKIIGRYIPLGLILEDRRYESFGLWEKTVNYIIEGNGDLAQYMHYKLAMQNRDAILLFLKDK